MNKSSLDRGLFLTTSFKKYDDVIKKNSTTT